MKITVFNCFEDWHNMVNINVLDSFHVIVEINITDDKVFNFVKATKSFLEMEMFWWHLVHTKTILLLL